MAKSAVNSVRKNVMLNRSSETRVRLIKEKADLPTDAEAIRSALRLYERFMTAQLEGCKIIIEQPDNHRVLCEPLYEPLLNAPASWESSEATSQTP